MKMKMKLKNASYPINTIIHITSIHELIRIIYIEYTSLSIKLSIHFIRSIWWNFVAFLPLKKDKYNCKYCKDRCECEEEGGLIGVVLEDCRALSQTHFCIRSYDDFR